MSSPPAIPRITSTRLSCPTEGTNRTLRSSRSRSRICASPKMSPTSSSRTTVPTRPRRDAITSSRSSPRAGTTRTSASGSSQRQRIAMNGNQRSRGIAKPVGTGYPHSTSSDPSAVGRRRCRSHESNAPSEVASNPNTASPTPTAPITNSTRSSRRNPYSINAYPLAAPTNNPSGVIGNGPLARVMKRLALVQAPARLRPSLPSPELGRRGIDFVERLT